ncbi:MAG: hypothetical protein QXN55_01750 [Candidatus Nitrosotenuis sp.]
MADNLMTVPIESFNFSQDIASSTWIINHNLNKQYPILDVRIDYNGQKVVMHPEAIEYTSPNTTTIIHSVERTGTVRII